MKICAILVPLLFAAAVPAFAMDCQAARSAVEKRICASDKLNQLDDSMNDAYARAMAEGDDPEQLRRGQVAWLKQVRAKCDSGSCLEQAYRARLSAIAAMPKYTWKVYSDKVLGVEFGYPGNRMVTRRGDDIYLTAFRMPEGTDYLVHFHVGRGDFDAANREEILFAQRDGKWYAAIGRFENPEAEAIKANGWSGLLTTVICGISDKETGFHAAGGECLWAMVSDGKRYVVADTQGVVGNDDETKKSLMSLRLLPRP